MEITLSLVKGFHLTYHFRSMFYTISLHRKFKVNNWFVSYPQYRWLYMEQNISIFYKSKSKFTDTRLSVISCKHQDKIQYKTSQKSPMAPEQQVMKPFSGALRTVGDKSAEGSSSPTGSHLVHAEATPLLDQNLYDSYPCRKGARIQTCCDLHGQIRHPCWLMVLDAQKSTLSQHTLSGKSWLPQLQSNPSVPHSISPGNSETWGWTL